jgi:hypothetical protein
MFCKMMKSDYKLGENDSENIEFEVEGFPFSLTWSIGERRCIGRTVPIVLYQLSVWHETHGGYWNPPEWVDNQICESQGVYDMMRAAFRCLLENQMSGIMETISYAEPQPVMEEV